MKEQTTELTVPKKASALVAMANRFSVEPAKLLDTLKATAFKNATNEEMMALVVVANQYGLNPFTRELYAFPAKGGGIQPIVSVDGWLRLMNEHPQFDGIEFAEEMGQDGKPISCTAIIYRKDRGRPTKVTEWFAEDYRNTEPWNTRPRRMLRHKATIQGARTAFGFAGIHDEDEVEVVSCDVPKVFSISAMPPPALPMPSPAPATVFPVGLDEDDIPLDTTPPAKPQEATATVQAEDSPGSKLAGAIKDLAATYGLRAAEVGLRSKLAGTIKDLAAKHKKGMPSYDDFVTYAAVQFQTDLSAFPSWESLPGVFCDQCLKPENGRLLERFAKQWGTAL